MRFGRTIAILIGLILFLSGALIALRWLHPQVPLRKGDSLIPLAPETVIEITWDVKDSKGFWSPMTLQREGEFWRMQTPYAGALCDQVAITKLLDTLQALRVSAPLEAEKQDTFQTERTLTVKTSDTTVTCAIGVLSPMTLSHALVKTNKEVVSVDTSIITELPTTATEMRTRALLPISEVRILSLEWRVPGQPFARALRMSNGNWNITRPFEFEAKANDVKSALDTLTSATLVTDYVAPLLETETPNLTSEVELARYGLDEEHAIRVSAHIRGLTDPITMRFGKDDPKQKDNIYALLDGYQAVVSIPKTTRAIFEDKGPFSTDFRNLPIFGESATAATQLTIQDTVQGPTIKLTRTQGGWNLIAPTNLPADATRAQGLLRTLSDLAGDLIGNDPPEDLPITCEFVLNTEGGNEMVLTCFDASATELYAYRHDQSRLYRIRRDALPAELFEENYEHTFVDRTVLSVPAATIRRIAVTRRDKSMEAVVRPETTGTWNTEHPRGAYVNTKVVDEWLTCFADLKALRVLRDMPTAYGALRPYGLDEPLLTLTLDLNGGESGLRRVLLIGTPDKATGKVPAVVQGRPILYELDAKILKLLQQSPTQREAPTK